MKGTTDKPPPARKRKPGKLRLFFRWTFRITALVVILILTVVSCRAGRVPAKPVIINGNATTYIEEYKDLANIGDIS